MFEVQIVVGSSLARFHCSRKKKIEERWCRACHRNLPKGGKVRHRKGQQRTMPLPREQPLRPLLLHSMDADFPSCLAYLSQYMSLPLSFSLPLHLCCLCQRMRRRCSPSPSLPLQTAASAYTQQSADFFRSIFPTLLSSCIVSPLCSIHWQIHVWIYLVFLSQYVYTLISVPILPWYVTLSLPFSVCCCCFLCFCSVCASVVHLSDRFCFRFYFRFNP